MVDKLTDLIQFVRFFDKMGVHYNYIPIDPYLYIDGDGSDKQLLIVAQSIFVFDLEGKYLRVEDSEMNGVYPNKTLDEGK